MMELRLDLSDAVLGESYVVDEDTHSAGIKGFHGCFLNLVICTTVTQ
jgi:hypothetical protein